MTGNRFALILIIAVTLAVRLIPALNSADWTDLYAQQAIPILEHKNVYETTHNVFPYSPVSMFIPPLCATIAYWLNVPFNVVMRMPAILADLFITLAIYFFIRKKDKKKALLWTLFYALNPLSILITSFHGNIISIATLFTFLSYTVICDDINKNYRLSALLLGLALGLRSYPVLLLPFFIMIPELEFKNKIKYIGYALIPTILSFIPFMFLNTAAIFREIFSYSGWPDHGFIALIRAASSLKTGMLQYALPYNLLGPLMQTGKWVFIATYLMLVLFHRNRSLIASIMLTFLFFYAFYPGVSSQYFIWILPFAFIANDKNLKDFIIIGTAALLSFYYLYHPQIIFGTFNPITLPLKPVLISQFVFLSLFWIFCLCWIFSLLFIKKDRQIEKLI